MTFWCFGVVVSLFIGVAWYVAGEFADFVGMGGLAWCLFCFGGGGDDGVGGYCGWW